ncbi:ParA family protein [Vibrio parahaemolyticus]|uniref:ParA family protein n=4 Tax=Vibrio parahaemolyticus TaxID=670 RepID=UPI00133162D0|nr:ParA family protein [Vibrio parahaemolyticus]MCX8824682.1 ParA family protein [Vibrio parahaemolyticus]MCX8835203.1 ParA family protein [Vibrio parahaemolyticus]MCX8840091.1 ParA family protein [Vibrio parahaemolyticus]MCX8850169.1 ParA family protein [Vibrio parahaemolyticus]MCX8885520.1 ParA family protein [Vibrio parahaemolyticus]
MPVICVANSKGGTGKTTISLNLIHHLNPDFIIDLDIHKGLSDLNRLGGGLEIHRTQEKDELLGWLEDDGKLIFIDTGGFDSTLNRVALSQSDFILTPTSDDPSDQLRLLDFDKTMAAVSEMVNEHLIAHALLNRVHHSRRSFDDFDELVGGLKHLARMPNVIPQSAALPKAAFKGMPVKSGTIAADFSNLAREIKKKL